MPPHSCIGGHSESPVFVAKPGACRNSGVASVLMPMAVHCGKTFTFDVDLAKAKAHALDVLRVVQEIENGMRP